MPSYNQVTIMGHLTRDIELRTAGATQVGSFGIAVNHNYKTASGEKREEVTFLDCEAWGKTAEILAQYISKGAALFVVGRLKQDSWDDKATGQKRTKLKVVVEDFQFIGGKGSKSDDDATPPRQQPQKRAPVASSVRHEPVDDLEIPF